MIKGFTKLGLAMTASLLLPLIAEAQILEAIEDDNILTRSDINENTAMPEFHLGAAMSGTSGLATIPTPDFNEKIKLSISGKSSSTDYDMKIGGIKVTNTKDESITSLRYNPKPELELSVTNLKYKRTNDANIKSLESKDNVVAGGMKYTNESNGKNFCLGFNFAPMSAEDMNNLDIEQLESMRNIYFTFSDQINNKFSSYFNIGSSFTKDQKIEISPGNAIDIEKKNIVYGGIGIEYHLSENSTLFGEFKVANYRDFEAYQDKPNRHRANIGVRFGSDRFQLEIIGMNFTGDEPNLVLGGTIGF